MTETPQDPSPSDDQASGPRNDGTIKRFAMAAVFLIVVVAGSVAWQKLTTVYHLANVQSGVLYRCGVHSVRDIQMATGSVTPKTVVSLVDDAEINDPKKPQFKEEMDFLKQRGIRLERIPVKLGGWPTTADVQEFVGLVKNPANQPVLIHCAQGVRRTGMLVAAYQESALGWDKERAKDEILTFGHSVETIKDIRRFIDSYDPKTGRVDLVDAPSDTHSE